MLSRFRWLRTLALLGLVCLLSTQTVAASHIGHDAIIYSFPAGDEVYPEGIAFHAGNGDFFAGSTVAGAVYRGNTRGTSRNLTLFLPPGSDGRTDVRGLEVDSQGRLWLAGGATGTMWMYDAVTGRFLSQFSNGIEGSFVNDVAIAPDGAAYFTDSRVPYIYKIAPDSEGIFRFEFWRDLSDSPIQFTEGFNLNGIVVTPDNKYLIVVQSNTGKLFRVAIDSPQIDEITIANGDRVTAGDGLLLDGSTLHVVRNSLNLIVQLRLSNDYLNAQQIGSFTHESFGFTTTIANADGRLLVINSQFNRRNNPDMPPIMPFTVSSVLAP
jgi:hypothetical protein